jgi:hypothetical protein
VATAVVCAIFAAARLPHLPDPVTHLAEFARVTRPGGAARPFHPIGRARLDHRHGDELDFDYVRVDPNLRPALTRTGWRCACFEDSGRALPRPRRL